ncbi:MAG: hypothetical protein Q9175_005403 [Cornicularia normoerica]
MSHVISTSPLLDISTSHFSTPISSSTPLLDTGTSQHLLPQHKASVGKSQVHQLLTGKFSMKDSAARTNRTPLSLARASSQTASSPPSSLSRAKATAKLPPRPTVDGWQGGHGAHGGGARSLAAICASREENERQQRQERLILADLGADLGELMRGLDDSFDAPKMET